MMVLPVWLRNPRLRVALLAGTALLAPLLLQGSGDAQAQSTTVKRGTSAPVSQTEPVTFTADSVEYDRDGALVTASGHVEAWQGDRVLRADRITFDRDTDVAAASGNVVLMEPDGEVLFSEYAELTQGMKEGILRDMRAVLAENGRLAANGARRLDGRINELSRLIYSTCNACKEHPDRPLLWDIRARSALQDVENKQIEYRDAVVDVYGVPVAYFPYLTQPDPSQKRASGFMIPSVGNISGLGPFIQIPYYLVLNDQSDMTITPFLIAGTGAALELQYRRQFNNGTMTINTSGAYDKQGPQGDIFANGQFALNDEWRYGFDVQRASSALYLQDFHAQGQPLDLLTSQVYLEGFGQGAYTRLDARSYQGLISTIVAAKIPFVLPHYSYSFVGEPDALGGRLGVEAGAFNILRSQGTSTERANLSLNWERPVTGALGDIYKFVLHVDSAAYDAHGLNQQPNYTTNNSAQTAQAMPTAALDIRWPFQRDAGDWGTQIVEPHVQLIAAPPGSSYINSRIPNEDSQDLEFTDANLFSLNRYPGVDRLEGGMRANVALHAAWYFGNNASVDGLVGQGYRANRDKAFAIGSGLSDTTTDIVSHLSYTPNEYFDITTRQRFDHNTYRMRFADAVGSVGTKELRLNAGYLYSFNNPYLYYDTPPTNVFTGPPRNEVTAGASSAVGPWKLTTTATRDVSLNKMVGVGAIGSYENECLILSANYYRRYTSINNDHGATIFLVQITLKTVGEFGFHAF